MIAIREDFRLATIIREGDAGRAWVDNLPALAERLLAQWEVVLAGGPHYGTAGLVMEVSDEQGRPLALKVSWQDSWSRDEALALEYWGGRGTVRLVSQDQASGALLLERLDPTRSLLDVGLAEALQTSCVLLNDLHQPCKRPFRTIESQQVPAVWSEKYRRALTDVGTSVYKAADSGTLFLLHGDFHYANVFAAGPSQWRVIDPKPLLGPREYDFVALLRNRFVWQEQRKQTVSAVTERLEGIVALTGTSMDLARLCTGFRALSDADFAHRMKDAPFEEISLAIAEASGVNVKGMVESGR